ncbi:hypothetical protein V6N13_088959 [Hibiscus sabdariffa]|uniref:Uncharacterized protein n=1 Tax=Hibiscus sabdariffa TaxID=183260 RepID=A0ABR2G0X9_9ROSI
MCTGSLILFVWEKLNKGKADAFVRAVASGLICGDGIWTLPSSILALAGVKPPICMKFLSRATNAKVTRSDSSIIYGGVHSGQVGYRATQGLQAQQ